MRRPGNSLRATIFAAIAAFAGLWLLMPLKAQVLRVDRSEPIVPTIGRADRHQAGKMFLERADSLISLPGNDYQILKGDVEFRKGDMFMYCDSAHFFDLTNSLRAFGNVRMEQGDTLFVYADELDYNDSTQLAILYSDPGKNVRLINRDVKLETPTFYYDLGIDLGYYTDGGVLTDPKNRLKSVYGEYAPNTGEALFRTDVDLQSLGKEDTLRIFSEQLYYNTRTHIAEIDMPAEIISKDGRIFTDSAIYNTDSEHAELFRRSTVVTSTNRTLTADSLVYNRQTGIGHAYGNMILTDTVQKLMLLGDYGFYNEVNDSALVTGRALAKEYSQGDTLYMHSDTIRAFRRLIIPETEPDTLAPAKPVVPDTIRYVVAAHKVKIFRTDLQGICDSLTFVSADSTLYLDRHPVVWSENRQIFGNIIEVHLNDSTVDYAHLPENGFMAEEIDPGFYQQLAGKDMLARFVNGEIHQLDVEGNVQAITFPEEKDSTINKMATLESSSLRAFFENRAIRHLKAWPQTKAEIIPLYLAKRSNLFLDKFRWYEQFRPTSPEDVMVISSELAEFLNSPVEESLRKRMMRNQQTAPPAALTPAPEAAE